MKQTKLFKLFQAWLIGCFLCLGATAAYAIHDDDFQLEGNAIEADTNDPHDDWQTLYDDKFNGDNDGSADVFTFVSENSDITIFGGGNKDIQDVSQWSWGDGAVPDKSDIRDAFAAAYTTTGDLQIYFGADRFANAGDTFLGFWFFVDDVGTNDDGTFYGSHTSVKPIIDNGSIVGYGDGDVLVLVNFPQAANAEPLIQVVVWDDSCSKAASNNPGPLECSAKNLRLIQGQSGAGAICGAGGAAADLACAISNSEGEANDPTPSPWPYTSKDGFVDSFPFETFFEGGINISQLIGGDGCFASFMAETRSSSSFTAQLKDFITGAFPLCGFEVDKMCEADINASDTEVTVSFYGNLDNTGVGPLSIDLTDTIPGNGSVVFDAFCVDTGSPGCSDDTLIPNTGTASMPTVLVPGATVVRYEGHYTVANPDLTDLNFSDTITATAYSVTGQQFGEPKTAQATCFAPNPGIDVTKNCSAALVNNDTYEATLSGTIENVGNVLLSDVDILDVATDGSGLTPNNWVAWYESVSVNGVKDAGEADFTFGTSDMEIGDLVAYEGSLQKTDGTNHSDMITASGDYLEENVVVETASDTASVPSCGLATQLSLTISKVCGNPTDTDGVSLVAWQGALAVQIVNRITVTNTGNTASHEDLLVDVVDSKAATISKISGASGMNCTNAGCTGRIDVGEDLVIETTYLPDASLGPILTQNLAEFTNKATATYYGVLTDPLKQNPADEMDSATCALCN